jgi:hypothetical protein
MSDSRGVPFTQDVDVAWFRNPLVHITMAADITTSSDFYFGNPDDLGNFPNTGFIYVKSTARTVRAMAYWHAARRRFPENHDQFVFNEIKRELADRLGGRIRIARCGSARWGRSDGRSREEDAYTDCTARGFLLCVRNFIRTVFVFQKWYTILYTTSTMYSLHPKL